MYVCMYIYIYVCVGLETPIIRIFSSERPFRLFARSSARSDAFLSLVSFARLDASPSVPDVTALGFAVPVRSGLVDRCSADGFSMC